MPIESRSGLPKLVEAVRKWRGKLPPKVETALKELEAAEDTAQGLGEAVERFIDAVRNPGDGGALGEDVIRARDEFASYEASAGTFWKRQGGRIEPPAAPEPERRADK
jgi:hypothetical protein